MYFGVGTMKITRAYTLSLDVVKILNHKPNKTEFVERAVRKLHKQEDEFDLRDIPTKSLMWALSRRDDCPRSLIVLIEDMMTD